MTKKLRSHCNDWPEEEEDIVRHHGNQRASTGIYSQWEPVGACGSKAGLSEKIPGVTRESGCLRLTMDSVTGKQQTESLQGTQYASTRAEPRPGHQGLLKRIPHMPVLSIAPRFLAMHLSSSVPQPSNTSSYG